MIYLSATKTLHVLKLLKQSGRDRSFALNLVHDAIRKTKRRTARQKVKLRQRIAPEPLSSVRAFEKSRFSASYRDDASRKGLEKLIKARDRNREGSWFLGRIADGHRDNVSLFWPKSEDEIDAINLETDVSARSKWKASASKRTRACARTRPAFPTRKNVPASISGAWILFNRSIATLATHSNTPFFYGSQTNNTVLGLFCFIFGPR